MAKKQAEPEVTEEPKKSKDKKDKGSTAAAVAQVAEMESVNTDEWQEMLDDLGSESNDPRVYYIKGGRNRIRLVPEGNDPKKFFYKFSRTYDGVVRTKFLIRGVVIKKDKDGDAPQVQVIPVGKMVIKQILNLLAEGYELFDPKKGRGVTIVKTGEGREGTSYNTLTSPDPVALPKGLLDLTDPMSKIAQEIQDADEKRQAEGGRTKRGSAAMGKGKAAESSSDESDW